MTWWRSALIVSIVPLLCGCGVYSFSATGKKPFASVSISQFDNKTIEYELADRLTDAVISGFITDNTIAVKEESRAEAVMTGTVMEYRRDPFTYDRQDVVSEYASKVKIHVKVVKANSDDVIWEDDFYAEGVYKADTETEADGQTRAISLLAANILDKTTKSW